MLIFAFWPLSEARGGVGGDVYYIKINIIILNLWTIEFIYLFCFLIVVVTIVWLHVLWLLSTCLIITFGPNIVFYLIYI